MNNSARAPKRARNQHRFISMWKIVALTICLMVPAAFSSYYCHQGNKPNICCQNSGYGPYCRSCWNNRCYYSG